MLGSTCLAQVQNIQLIKTCDSAYELKDSTIKLDDSQTYDFHLTQRINQLIKEDYLEASIDSTQFDSTYTNMKAYLHIGPKYNFSNLNFDSLSQKLLSKLDIGVPKSSAEFLLVREKLSSYYADRGYPFAQVRMKDLEISQGIVNGRLDITEGRQVIMDSIILEGDVTLRQGYLNNYLQLYSGKPYDHTKISGLKRKLDKLAFLRTTQDPYLSFINDYASVHLPVAAKNTSRFDLIFGVIPTNAIEGRQLFLSLDVTAEMLNKLGYGEYIYFNFERLRPEQQQLQFKFNYPYILDTPFAIDTEFGIFRNSTDYQTVIADLGVQYLINSSDHIKVSYNYESSKLIDIDTARILQTQQLPEDLSIVQSGIALEGLMSTLDYQFNPRRGMALNLGVVIGRKQILIDPTITTLRSNFVDYSMIYDSLELKTNRYQAKLNFEIYQPLARRGALGLHLKGGWRYSKAGLYRNEKFQIGGHKLLRGFDEGSIFTSYYGLATIDYRLLLSSNSYLSFPFVDIAYLENSEGNGTMAYGVGGSLAFETKVGLFNFSIAAGRDENSGFDFARPKAHFGFVSLF